MEDVLDSLNHHLYSLVSDTYASKEIIEGELHKYLSLVEDLDLLRHPDTQHFITYNDFIEIVNRANIKSIHFKQYESYRNPIQFVLKNILEEGIVLLSKLVEHSHDSRLTEFASTYNSALREFVGKVPCYEEYVRKLQGYIMIVEKKLATLSSSASSLQNVVSEKMSPGDFRFDGGFSKEFSPTLNVDNLIALSLLSFNLSLCNGKNVCASSTSAELGKVAQAYNEHNYRSFLTSIRFFDNPTFHTQGMDWNGVVDYFRRNDIDLPSPGDVELGKMCCIHDLEERQKFIGVGGRRRRRRTKRRRKTKAQKNRRRKKQSAKKHVMPCRHL